MRHGNNGKSAKGFKVLKDEWFFEVHWPMIQICLMLEWVISSNVCFSYLTLPNNKGKIVYLTSANNLKFAKKYYSN